MQELREFSTLQVIAVMSVPLILAIVLHEVMHGYVAWAKGDDTAMRLGRLTLNPLAHVDPFGTILLPLIFFYSTGMLFAFAKPVPVNFLNLRRPKEDMVWVAAAGPGTNVALALASSLLLKLLTYVFPEVDSYVTFISMRKMPPEASAVLFPLAGMLFYSIVLNVILAVINLIPIPPADGGRIAVGLLPQKQAEAYSRIESIGIFLIIFIIVFNPLGITHRIIWPLIISIVEFLI